MAGTIEKRGKNSYRLTVTNGYDAAGQQIRYRKTVQASSDRAAEKMLAIFIGEVERGQIANTGKMTLRDFFVYWEKNYALPQHEPKTISFNRGLFKRIDLALGHKRIDKITPKNLLDFYQNLREPIKTIRRKQINPDKPAVPEFLSPNTIRKYHVLLHTLFEKATQWQFTAYNPVEKVEPPKVALSHKQIYDEETTGKFLLALQAEELKHRLMALLSISTGMRRGELFGLEWKHIDFGAETINIEQTSQYLPTKGIFTKAPKTQGSKRVITAPSSVMQLLKQYKAEQNARRLKLGDKWQESDRIFTTWDGKPAHPDSINTWLKKFVADNDFPPITPHSFRHMAATYLITSGTDLRTVAGKLGHNNSTTTQIVYSHLLKSAEKETATKMESFLQQVAAKAKSQQKKQVNKPT